MGWVGECEIGRCAAGALTGSGAGAVAAAISAPAGSRMRTGAATAATGIVRVFWHVGQAICVPLKSVSHKIFWPHSGHRNRNSLIRLCDYSFSVRRNLITKAPLSNIKLALLTVVSHWPSELFESDAIFRRQGNLMHPDAYKKWERSFMPLGQ